jgi:hypothetical protein
MTPRLLMAVMIAVSAAGCNQLFGLDAPARADGDGGGDDDGGGDGDGGGDDGDGGGSDDANPDDVDNDGVADAIDNCPGVSNPLQADEDSDADISGGDACDLCPHQAAPSPGAQHADVDQDGVGDDCDPSTQIKHCWRWFDGFQGDPDVVLGRYDTTRGAWKVMNGELVQLDLYANLAEATVQDRAYVSPVVAARGVPTAIADSGGDAGVTPTQNAVGVTAGRTDLGAGTCFGVVMRRVATPTAAAVALVREGQLSEVIFAETTIPNSRMVPGERVFATADLATASGTPRILGKLPDDNPQEVLATASAQCSLLGRAGVRTQFATVGFHYLYVIEVEGTSGCGRREP